MSERKRRPSSGSKVLDKIQINVKPVPYKSGACSVSESVTLRSRSSKSSKCGSECKSEKSQPSSSSCQPVSSSESRSSPGCGNCGGRGCGSCSAVVNWNGGGGRCGGNNGCKGNGGCKGNCGGGGCGGSCGNNGGCNNIYVPAYSSLQSIVTPLTNVQALNGKSVSSSSPNNESINFVFRRKNNVITFQFAGFKGAISAAGITHLSVNQPLGFPPPYKVTFPIKVTYNNNGLMGYMEVDPHGKGSVRFFFSYTGTSTIPPPPGSTTTTTTAVGDTVEIPGTCVSWIIGEC